MPFFAEDRVKPIRHGFDRGFQERYGGGADGLLKAGIAKASDLSVFAINVPTYKGVVQLAGFVNTAAQRHTLAGSRATFRA